MPTAKSATNHTLPVVTVKQISTLYDVTGKAYKHVRGKLEILGYIKPLRTGSFTYHLLKWNAEDFDPVDMIDDDGNVVLGIPPTLEDLEREYLSRVYTYLLPHDYQVIRDKVEALMEDIGESCQRHWDGQLGELHSTAHELLKQAYVTLPEHILPNISHSFVCSPIYDEKLEAVSRQHKLENIVNLLRVIYREVKEIYRATGILDQGFIPVMLYDLEQATEILTRVNIPTIFKERKAAQP